MKRENGKIIVERGDSLASIAHALDIPLHKLIDSNQGRLPLKMGEAVKMPDDLAGESVHADTSPPTQGEGGNGKIVVEVSEEQIAELVAEVEAFHKRVEALESESGELRKLCADAFEALQSQSKTHNEQIDSLTKRIDVLEFANEPAKVHEG